MNTPIYDFLHEYAGGNTLRLHMPGHKGIGPLGVEVLDLTEIDGADSLFEADGIIRESEENASALFACPSFYSTEGSSLVIRAMLYLATLYAKAQGRPLRILAGRNAHKTFLSAVALLDLDVQWLYGETSRSYLSCQITAEYIDAVLQSAEIKPFALYITSPDYLGAMADIAAISAVCHRHGVLLLVDNAHGAYLRFLPKSLHPMDLGADMSCSSAHKTLSVLTGGAYLHISADAPALFVQQAKNALSLFASTSPSYLILASLDAANRALAQSYPKAAADFVAHVADMKHRLRQHGFQLYGDEPFKLTIQTKPWGYNGSEMARRLADSGIVVEFADPDFIVMMLAPELQLQGLARLERALCDIAQRQPITIAPPAFSPAERVMSVREAMLSVSKRVPIQQSKESVLATASVGCPPAVPIVVCGERIDAHALDCFKYYGIEHCWIVSNS